MSVYSSVATSRINSAFISQAAARSEQAATSSSGLSRISVREAINAAAQKLDQSSLRTSIRSRISLSTQLCDFLESNLIIDEYGFTDKLCKKCQNRLSLEEILALCIPMGTQRGEPDLSTLKIDDSALICLSCYAEYPLFSIVAKRAGLKPQIPRLVDLKPVGTNTSEDQKEVKSVRPQSKAATKRGLSGDPAARHTPALPDLKPPGPSQIKSSTSHTLQRRKRAYSV